MSKTGAELIDEVRENVGRTDDSEVITESRVLGWVNDSQRRIARKSTPKSLQDKNITSMDTSQSLSYKLSDFTSRLAHTGDSTATNNVCHVMSLWYVNGADSKKLKFMPTDEFDENYIDPTHSDFGVSENKNWTRRGNNIEIVPVCTTDKCNKTLRLDSYLYPRDFTGVSTTETSDLEDADEGIILYATAKSWERIGGDEGKVNALTYKALFDSWVSIYSEENDVMHAWDANLYGDYE